MINSTWTERIARVGGAGVGGASVAALRPAC